MTKKTTKQADISTTFSPKKIASLVCEVRGEPVLLDADLAELYHVETRVLKQAVRRNINRFPKDFMFELTAEEVDAIYVSRSQSVIMKRGHNVKYMPFAFTEEGVAMLSSVLRSPSAVEVNIAIMRTFVQLRKLMDGNRELARKIKSLEKRYDEQFDVVFKAIQQLLEEDDQRKKSPKRKMGFQP
jgi:hypothetical protein